MVLTGVLVEIVKELQTLKACPGVPMVLTGVLVEFVKESDNPGSYNTLAFRCDSERRNRSTDTDGSFIGAFKEGITKWRGMGLELIPLRVSDFSP